MGAWLYTQSRRITIAVAIGLSTGLQVESSEIKWLPNEASIITDPPAEILEQLIGKHDFSSHQENAADSLL